MLNFYRALVFFFVVLYVIYIITVLLQLIGIIRITYRDITFKALIPFYYWINRYTNSNAEIAAEKASNAEAIANLQAEQKELESLSSSNKKSINILSSFLGK